MARANNINQREWLKVTEIPQYVPIGLKSAQTLVKERRIKSVKPGHGPALTRKKWIDEYLESCGEANHNTCIDDILKGVTRGR